MKILIVVDKVGTAIDRLAKMVQKYNPHHDIRILPVHPKRNDVDTLYEASQLLGWCDIIDIHYWKSGEVLRQTFGDAFDRKPKILFHFNPYDIDKMEWNKIYDRVVVGNQTIYNQLPYAFFIPYGVELDFFKFKEDYIREDLVQMSVNRIEGKKGIYEVAVACKELGYKLLLIGRVSDPEYANKVMGTGVVEFWENATDEQLRESYYKSAIHVCNSQDSFESGTLPVLEAMACGTPVLTRNIGHIPDLNNGKNMLVREGGNEDIDDLKKNLKELIENPVLREKLRQSAWDTVRTRDSRIMSRRISKLYNGIYKPTKPLVSIIIPTKDNPEAFTESLVKALVQDYDKYEIVVADSGKTSVKPIIDIAKNTAKPAIKYIRFDDRGTYTLAEARNRAIIEAEGEVIVFCDDRIAMDKDAVSWFAKSVTPKTWVWGVKDGFPKGFVENFSAVLRADLVQNGLLCERMQWYGGMTQEIRTRFESQLGFEFIIINDAKATGIKKSKSKSHRRDSIIEAKFTVHKLYGD